MEIMEIISDAIHYPLNHIKELGIYIILCIVLAFILVFTLGGLVIGTNADSSAATGIVGIIGFILILIVSCLIEGYGLDIVKLGIERSEAAPGIDITRQVVNGIKYLILGFVYLIIPFIIMLILSMINDTLGAIVGLILFVIFGVALFMGACRLANTESLGEALNIGESIQDLKRAGIVKVFAVIILVVIIGAILSYIAGLFTNMGDIGAIISGILSAIVGAYTFFFQNRAIGLLYSDIA